MIFADCPNWLFIDRHYNSRSTRPCIKALHFALRGKNEPLGSQWKCSNPEQRFEVKMQCWILFFCSLNSVSKVYLVLQLYTCILEIRMEEGKLTINLWLCLNKVWSSDYWAMSKEPCPECLLMSFPMPTSILDISSGQITSYVSLEIILKLVLMKYLE